MSTTPSWTELLELLAEPFPPGAIRWRAGQVSKDRKEARALPYVDARHYERRLDELCPGAWGVRFHGWGENRIICELTIYGVTRASTGEASEGSRAPGTSAEAQAFKRACSKFKLGRCEPRGSYVYWVNHLQPQVVAPRSY
jgi:hypothetical protein